MPSRKTLAVVMAAWCNTAQARTTTVSQIDHLIETMGAHDAVVYLDKVDELDYMLDQIGRGKSEWIALATRIAPGTDASASEGLGISLARALPRNPSAVLRVVDLADEDGVLGVSRVCGVPFIEVTRAYNAAYERRAIPAVSRVLDPALAAARAKCLARLKSP